MAIGSSCTKAPDKGSPEHIQQVTSTIDGSRIMQADANQGDWLSYGRNYSEDRFSTLDQIDASNVADLGLVWSYNLGTKRGVEATPLVVDGIMYLSGPWSKVFALDVRKGTLIWEFDPKVPGAYGEKACCDVVNRGVALYKGLVFIGTIDGRLIALDAVTGEVKWEELTIDRTYPYTITQAPRVVEGKVIIGNSGAEYGVRGYFSAYDALTGEMAWRFYTVPGDPSLPFETPDVEAAAKTWNGEWWKYGGGGTVWDAMAYDPELKLLYIGTGNGSPWNRELRSPGGGDNLYLSSILAVNPDDGSLAWYYQTTPGESWDFTATQHIILADLEIEGKKRKVLMQAPKNGFFYVLDRESGELISADKYVYVNWAEKVDLETGRPIETSFARYVDVNARLAPNYDGGHNWMPMAFNPNTGLVYIPATHTSSFYGQLPNWEFNKTGFAWPLGWNPGIGNEPANPRRDDPLAPKEPKGELIAWDPVAKRKVWGVDYPTQFNGGVLSTPELIFQANAEGIFRAYLATTGEEIWKFEFDAGVLAPPLTYLVDGVQYITIAVGWGGGFGKNSVVAKAMHPGTVYTFALGGSTPKPDYPDARRNVPIDLPVTATPEELAEAAGLYVNYCHLCHGGVGSGDGPIPDLAFSTEETHNMYRDIVLGGVFLEKGMPKFDGRLTEEQAELIHQHILASARKGS